MNTPIATIAMTVHLPARSPMASTSKICPGDKSDEGDSVRDPCRFIGFFPSKSYNKILPHSSTRFQTTYWFL